MEKDFLDWHKKKESLHKKDEKIYFHEREIWWCSLGLNIGDEQDGKNKNYSKRLSAPPFVMEQISSFSLFLTRMNGENIEALARAY